MVMSMVMLLKMGKRFRGPTSLPRHRCAGYCKCMSERKALWFEEVCFLLLFEAAQKDELNTFCDILWKSRYMQEGFVEDVILKEVE